MGFVRSFAGCLPDVFATVAAWFSAAKVRRMIKPCCVKFYASEKQYEKGSVFGHLAVMDVCAICPRHQKYLLSRGF